MPEQTPSSLHRLERGSASPSLPGRVAPDPEEDRHAAGPLRTTSVLLSAALLVLLGTALALLARFALLEPAPPERGPARSADIDAGGLRGFDHVNAEAGELVVRPAEGTQDAFVTAVLRPPFDGVARGAWEVDWQSGDTVCYGLSVRFPPGFLPAAGAVDVLRWDAYATDDDHPAQGGLSITADDRVTVFLERAAVAGTYEVLAETQTTLPSGRWTRLVVQQHLSRTPGEASTVLFVDGEAVATSSGRTSWGQPADALRAGLVAVHGDVDADVLLLDVDDAFFAERPCGSADR